MPPPPPQAESGPLLSEAARRGLTSPQFMWLSAQSVVGDARRRTNRLPVGMIAVHFDVKIEAVLQGSVARPTQTTGDKDFIIKFAGKKKY